MDSFNNINHGTQNYYSILDVTSDATEQEIKNSYLKMKNAYSRDSVATYSLFDQLEKNDFLEKIEEAYMVLSNPDKRNEYDKVNGLANPCNEISTDLQNSIQIDNALPANQTQKPKQEANRLNAGMAELSGMDDSPSVFDEPAPPINEFRQDSMFSTQESNPKPQPERFVINRESPLNEPYERNVNPLSEKPFMGNHSNQHTSDPTKNHSDNFALPTSNMNELQREAPSPQKHEVSTPYNENSEIELEINEEKDFRGEFIRKVREYKRVSLEELSSVTKIRMSYLEAIERENWKSLPATVYVRGFVYQVARALKLDADKVSSNYIDHYKVKLNEEKNIKN